MFSATQRIRGYGHAIAVGFVPGAMLSGTAAFANAGMATSMPTAQSPTVDDHKYDSNATIYTQQPTTPSDYAESLEVTNGGENVSPGFMGVNARKYKNGSVCEQTGPQYNSDATNDMYRIAGSTTCGSGVYSSDGLFYAWNGSTYDTGPTTNLNG